MMHHGFRTSRPTATATLACNAPCSGPVSTTDRGPRTGSRPLTDIEQLTGRAHRLRTACLIGIASCTVLMPLAANAQAATSPVDGYSAAALYDQGNAYARAGKPGLAVLQYERAQLLAPGDADIRANLRFVRTAAKVPLDPPGRLERLATAIGPSPLAGVGVLGIVLIGGWLIAGQVTQARRGLRRLAALAGIACVGLTAGQATVLWPATQAAVVVNATQALVSPVPMGDVLFSLPEAETVHIDAEHESYLLVRTRAGRAGWVSRANVAAVVPAAARPK